MTVVVSAAAKIAALDALLALINGGSGDSTGDFIITTSGDSILATLPFSATSFAGATNVGGVITAAANSITPSGVPTAGTIAKGAFRNKANTPVINFGIATSGSDMDVASVTVPADATSVTCSGLTVTLEIVGA